MCTYIDKLHTLLKNTKSYMYIIYVYIINIDQLHTLLHGSMEECRGSQYMYAVMKLKRLCAYSTVFLVYLCKHDISRESNSLRDRWY